MKVWNIESGQELRTLVGHSDRVTSVALSVALKRVISSSGENTLKVWDIATGKLLITFFSDSAFQCCALTPDNKTLVAGNVAGRVMFFDLVLK